MSVETLKASLCNDEAGDDYWRVLAEEREKVCN